MALTRAATEAECCRLFGRLMEMVGLFGGVVDGTNPTLNSAIRDGLQRMGYALADPAGLTVADADLAALDKRALRRLLEWTELHVMEWVERDWWRAEAHRPRGLEVTSEGGLVRDPLASIKARVVARIAQLRVIVTTPYQSMNVPLAVGQITRGSTADPTLPRSFEQIIPAWELGPDLGWYGGCSPAEFWGWC